MLQKQESKSGIVCLDVDQAIALVEYSVVIPAFNMRNYIAYAVVSAIDCAGDRAEVIVVNDGSTDGTADELAALQRKYPSLKVITQTNRGVSNARNAGLQLAAAEFVCFLDADDRLKPHCLDRLSRSLAKHPHAVAAYGRCAYIDSLGDRIELRRPMSRRAELLTCTDVLERNFIDTPGAVLFRTGRVREVGGFTDGLRKAQDWELYTRVATLGPIAFCDETVLEYRLHNASSLRQRTLWLTDFEPTLAVVFGRPARFYGLPDKLLRRLEWRSRANVVQLCSLVNRGLRGQVATVRQALAVLSASRYDWYVIEVFLRTVVSAIRRIV